MRLSDLPILPAAGLLTGQIPVRYSGGNYRVPLSDISGGVTAAVSPQQYGGDPTGSAAADAAVAAAFATGRPVLIDGWYRLTTTLAVPSSAQMQLANYDCGFIADMATGYAVTFGDDCIVPSLRVKSVAYPVSTIANSATWNLYNRAVKSGNRCLFGVVGLDGLAGGLDISDVTGCQVIACMAANIRTRYGWGAGLHIAGGSNHRVGYVYVGQSDRGCEVEKGAVDVQIASYLFESVYPNGYSGAPADGTGATNYLRTSWSGPNVHSHIGEPPCRDIVWGDGVVRDCVNPINVQSSASSDTTTYPEGVKIGRVVIESPRVASTQTFKEVASLCGRGIDIEAIEFTGTPQAEIDAMISTWGAYSEDIEVRRVKAKAGAWYGRMVQFAAPESRIGSYDIATQATTDTTRRANPAMNVAAAARNFSFGAGLWRAPQYHAALFHAQGGGTPAGGRRIGTRIIAAGSNQPAAVEAASFSALTVFRSDNIDA